MIPYLIAGAIGFVVAKLFEEDEAPKYADGGDINYSNFRTSVIGLVNDNKVLILQRGSTANWMPNKWSIVGGVIEEGEVPIEAIIRECKEEIGLEPSNVYYDHKIMTNDSGEIYYFVGTLESTDVKLDYENSAYKFISKDEIDNYDFVPYIKEFILSIFLRNTNKLNNHFADGGSLLLAPNGKPSNLTPEQYKLVRTNEFKAWFGDWENDPENASKVVDENYEPLVVWHRTFADFTEFDNTKSTFKKGFVGGNSFYFSNDRYGYSNYGDKEIAVFVNLRNPTYKVNVDGEYIKSSNDGAILKYDRFGEKETSVVATNPTQIKLADGTNTTFDGENADIRYVKGGNLK